MRDESLEGGPRAARALKRASEFLDSSEVAASPDQDVVGAVAGKDGSDRNGRAERHPPMAKIQRVVGNVAGNPLPSLDCRIAVEMIEQQRESRPFGSGGNVARPDQPFEQPGNMGERGVSG